MAEGDATVYNNFFEMMLNGTCDLTNDTMRIMLLGTGYTFSRTGNPGYGDVSAHEINVSGYVAQGAALASQAVTQNDTDHNAKFDANDTTWVNLAATTIAHAILYDDTIGTPVNDPLLVRWELSTNSNGGNYTLQWHDDGIIEVS